MRCTNYKGYYVNYVEKFVNLFFLLFQLLNVQISEEKTKIYEWIELYHDAYTQTYRSNY